MRDLYTTFPSPSEMDEWNFCQYKWLMKSRLRIVPVAVGMQLVLGSAISDAIEKFYSGSGEPMEAFWSKVNAMEGKMTGKEEKWQQEVSLAKDVLELYLKSRTPSFHGKVLAIQPRWERPGPMRPDLIVECPQTGKVKIVDQKSVSGFADVSYENLKYEMASQPGLYIAGARNNGFDGCSTFVIDYLQKGKLASGRYKATPPILPEPYEFEVEDWKVRMHASSALWTNECMKSLMHEFDADTPLSWVPRRVINCVQKFGSKNFLCDYYAACSSNCSPLDVRGEFMEREESTGGKA